MEIEKSRVLIKFLLNFRQSGDVLFFPNGRRLRVYTAIISSKNLINKSVVCNKVAEDNGVARRNSGEC